MFETFSYINGIVWFIVGVIMAVGNLTYADYYTNRSKDFHQIFWCIYGTCMGVAVLNFSIIFLIKYGLDRPSMPSPLNFGLGWLTALSLVVYIILFLCYVIIFFKNLKTYFGHKRNKL